MHGWYEARYVMLLQQSVLYVIDFSAKDFWRASGFSIIFSLLSFVDTKEQNNVVVSAISKNSCLLHSQPNNCTARKRTREREMHVDRSGC